MRKFIKFGFFILLISTIPVFSQTTQLQFPNHSFYKTHVRDNTLEIRDDDVKCLFNDEFKVSFLSTLLCLIPPFPELFDLSCQPIWGDWRISYEYHTINNENNQFVEVYSVNEGFKVDEHEVEISKLSLNHLLTPYSPSHSFLSYVEPKFLCFRSYSIDHNPLSSSTFHIADVYDGKSTVKNPISVNIKFHTPKMRMRSVEGEYPLILSHTLLVSLLFMSPSLVVLVGSVWVGRVVFDHVLYLLVSWLISCLVIVSFILIGLIIGGVRYGIIYIVSKKKKKKEIDSANIRNGGGEELKKNDENGEKYDIFPHSSSSSSFFLLSWLFGYSLTTLLFCCLVYKMSTLLVLVPDVRNTLIKLGVGSLSSLTIFKIACHFILASNNDKSSSSSTSNSQLPWWKNESVYEMVRWILFSFCPVFLVNHLFFFPYLKSLINPQSHHLAYQASILLGFCIQLTIKYGVYPLIKNQTKKRRINLEEKEKID